MEFSGSSIKKFIIFSQEKAFLIYRKTETPKKFFIFQKNGTFLYFSKRKGIGKGIFRTLGYLEPEAYSDSWYIQNPRHIQNTVKHLRCNVL